MNKYCTGKAGSSLSKKISVRWAFLDKSSKIETGDKNDREKQKKP